MNTTQSFISSCIFGPKIQQKQQIRTAMTNAPTMVDTYKAILVCFMSFLKEHEYDKEYEFSLEELGAVLTPIDVKKYMCYRYRAYGTAEPGPAAG
jgi:hypothetical protein